MSDLRRQRKAMWEAHDRLAGAWRDPKATDGLKRARYNAYNRAREHLRTVNPDEYDRFMALMNAKADRERTEDPERWARLKAESERVLGPIPTP